MRLVMASIGLSRTQLSTSGLQVGDLKASVTPSLHRCCVDVSVSCSCAHLQGQHDARSRPLLLRSLGPKVSEGTRHHRHALDGLPRRKPCTTAVWDESVSFPRLTTTYVWTSPSTKSKIPERRRALKPAPIAACYGGTGVARTSLVSRYNFQQRRWRLDCGTTSSGHGTRANTAHWLYDRDI